MRPKPFLSVFLPLLAILSPLSMFATGAPAAKPVEQVIYAFQNNGDGALPYAGLIADAKGDLYGTTAGYYGNGAICIDNNCGTAFQLKPPSRPAKSWTYTTLHVFSGGGDGQAPGSPLIFDGAGNLYGTTSSGGTGSCYLGCGTVFELSPNASGGWTETVLYSFQGGTDGQNPEGALVFDKNGALYGTTVVGGEATCSYGTVFQLTPPSERGGAWTENVLYRFNSFDSGFWPEVGVVFDRAGALYGTTNEGGQGGCSDGCGVVFRLVPPRKQGGTWVERVLYAFTGESDGGAPYAGVTFDRSGNLYGTTSLGHKNAGAVYMLTPPTKKNGAWTETTLYTCSTDSGPFFIKAGVILDKARNIYGTSETGGPRYLGNVFKLKPPAKRGGTWTESELHRFRGGNDGRWPFAGLMFGKDGALYGTTLNGGGGNCLQGQHDFGCGTVFKLVP